MTTVRAYDPRRLEKASVRPSWRLGPNQFRVKGNEEEFYDVNLDLDTPCTCLDAFYHGRGCLHELRARMHNGDTELLTALGEMIQRLNARKERQTRRSPRAIDRQEKQTR